MAKKNIKQNGETYGEILGEERTKIVASSLEELMAEVNDFTGKSQVSRMVNAALKKSDRMIRFDQEYGDVMAAAFADTLNSGEAALFTGGQLYFKKPEESELADYISELDPGSSRGGLAIYKFDRDGHLKDDEPKYEYRFGIEDVG